MLASGAGLQQYVHRNCGNTAALSGTKALTTTGVAATILQALPILPTIAIGLVGLAAVAAAAARRHVHSKQAAKAQVVHEEGPQQEFAHGGGYGPRQERARELLLALLAGRHALYIRRQVSRARSLIVAMRKHLASIISKRVTAIKEKMSGARVKTRPTINALLAQTRFYLYLHLLTAEKMKIQSLVQKRTVEAHSTADELKEESSKTKAHSETVMQGSSANQPSAKSTADQQESASHTFAQNAQKMVAIVSAAIATLLLLAMLVRWAIRAELKELKAELKELKEFKDVHTSKSPVPDTGRTPSTSHELEFEKAAKDHVQQTSMTSDSGGSLLDFFKVPETMPATATSPAKSAGTSPEEVPHVSPETARRVLAVFPHGEAVPVTPPRGRTLGPGTPTKTPQSKESRRSQLAWLLSLEGSAEEAGDEVAEAGACRQEEM